LTAAGLFFSTKAKLKALSFGWRKAKPLSPSAKVN